MERETPSMRPLLSFFPADRDYSAWIVLTQAKFIHHDHRAKKSQWVITALLQMCAKHSDPMRLQLNSLSGLTLRISVESPQFWFSTISTFDAVFFICLLALGPILHWLWTEFLPFVLSQSHSWVPKKRKMHLQSILLSLENSNVFPFSGMAALIDTTTFLKREWAFYPFHLGLRMSALWESP